MNRKSKILQSKAGILAIATVGIILGILFIVSQMDNKPISREEAVYYEGTFEAYRDQNPRYRTIHFEDGSCHEVYPHTQTAEFGRTMKALEKGTKLYVAVNPHNRYVIEVKNDTDEILNFEQSQKAIDAFDNGLIAIGAVVCCAGVFMIWYAFASSAYKGKETEKARGRTLYGDGESRGLRTADTAARCKILLQAETDGYHICYRRVKTVNELVINGTVYDEKKGLVEFAHNLSATLDGHTIEAGYDEDAMSYILFDNKRIKEKRRVI